MKGLLSCFLIGAFVAVVLAQEQAENEFNNANNQTEQEIKQQATIEALQKLGTTTNLTTQTAMSGEQVIRDVKNHPEVIKMMQSFMPNIATRAQTRMITLVPDAVGFQLGGHIYILGYKTALDGNTEIYYIRWAFHNDAGQFGGYSFIFHVKITVAIASGKCHWNWSPAELEGNVKNARVVLVVGPKPDDSPIDMMGDFNDADVTPAGRGMDTPPPGNVLFDELSKRKDVAVLRSSSKLFSGEKAMPSPTPTKYVSASMIQILEQSLALLKATNAAFTNFNTKAVASISYMLKGTDYYIRTLIDGKFLFHIKLTVPVSTVTAVKVTGPKKETEEINTNEFV